MIKIICVGKLKEKYLIEFVNDYKNRINKYHKLDIIELKDSNIVDESNEIIKNLNSKDYNIYLDINGEKLNSLEFSKLIEEIFTNGYGNIIFIIGGSNGVNEDVKALVNKRISFSDMTFPHGVFRGILLEQIYRSFKIINNESYHK